MRKQEKKNHKGGKREGYARGKPLCIFICVALFSLSLIQISGGEEKRLSEKLEEAWQQLPSVLFDSRERYRVIHMFNLKNLVKKVQKKDDVMESAMAHRLLGLLALDAYSEGMTYYGKGLLTEAAVYLEIASEASLERPDMLYNLACVYSLKGEKKKALKTLKRAVEKGFKDVETIINDTDLAPLRETEEFKALLESLKRTA